MKAAEKDVVMRAFKAGELDLLVATTVIEVGVDVPNATLMVVENAERMGLAQLHQLRGRVGRGAQASSVRAAVSRRRCRSSRGSASACCARRTTASPSRRRTSSCAAPAKCSARGRRAVMQLRVADLLRDADLLPQVIEISERAARDGARRPSIR